MIDANVTADFLKLQANVKRVSLPDLCRKEGRSPSAALRVASHLVFEEDVEEGEVPRHCTPAIELAKEIHRLERKAADPEYPDGDRKWYQKNKANSENVLSYLRTGLLAE